MLGPELDGAAVAERLMPPLLGVLLQPVPNDRPRLLERLKHVLPDTFFFQTAKELLDDPILFRCIGRDELLLQLIVPTYTFPSAATLLAS